MTSYQVNVHGRKAGNATVTQNGLYYRIVCRCTLPSKDLYRLQLHCGDKKIDLGICVPEGDGFCVDRNLPVKLIGTGDMRFELVGREARLNFLPVDKDTPVSCLDRISLAHFEIRDGAAGLVLPAEYD